MRLNLSVKKILEKEFKKKSVGGLDPRDVDQFLNLVIEDYETIGNYITVMKEQISKLRDENYKLKKDKIHNTQNLNKFDEEITDIDLEKRLNLLEEKTIILENKLKKLDT